jgi:polar amino acid transport system substrate-binding protein
VSLTTARPPRTAVALLLSLVVACTGAAGPEVPTLERLRTAGVVRIGYANEAPYAYRDTASGQLTGEAPVIARAILRQMGIPEIEGVLTEFGSLIPGLQAGRFDIIAAGMYITPARCGQIAFSNPTYSIGEAFIVPAGNPLGLDSYESLRDTPEATLGVVIGAIQSSYGASVGIQPSRIITFPDPPSAVAGVRAGRVSVYAGTNLTVQGLLSRDSEGIEQATPFNDPVIDGASVRGYGAFGFRVADTTFRAEVDRQIAAIIGTPVHQALVAPFGFGDLQLPGTVTAAELCASD